MQIKFLAHDFKGAKLPTKLGSAVVKSFMGYKNVPIVVVSLHGNFVMAELNIK